MGQPAAILNDRITGMCTTHQVPGPTGGPIIGPPVPFSAPLTIGLTSTVLIGGAPVAKLGSSGLNTPAHLGLYPTDPHATPPTQIGRVMAGSTTVHFEGMPAAYTGCQTSICFNLPGILTGTAVSVQIGP